MKNSKKTQDKISSVLNWGVAVSLVTISYYLFSTDKGIKKRKELNELIENTKETAIDKVERITKIDEEEYKKMLKDILIKYYKLKKIDPKKIVALSSGLKKHF